MSKPIIRIHNIETDEIIDREMTTAEFKQFEIEQKNNELLKAKAEEKKNAKAALLERLGITEDEAKLLLG